MYGRDFKSQDIFILTASIHILPVICLYILFVAEHVREKHFTDIQD